MEIQHEDCAGLDVHTLCPGHHESAGPAHGGKPRPGNRALRCALVQAAHAAGRTKKRSFCGLYRRLSARRGKNKALIAVAHRRLNIVYLLLKTGRPDQELGVDYDDKLDPRARDRAPDQTHPKPWLQCYP